MFPVLLTGIRDGERIISTEGSGQNAGSELIVRGSYPPSRREILSLTDEDQDRLLEQIGRMEKGVASRQGNAGRPLAPEPEVTRAALLDRLITASTDDDDLYLNEVDLLVMPVALSGTLFNSALTDEERLTFLKPNPNREDGYWELKTIFRTIRPKKANTKAKNHTLVFRPTIWQVKDDGVTAVRGGL